MTDDSPQLHPISHEQYLTDVQALACLVEADSWRPDILVGIGRGGLVPAVYLSHRLNLPMISIDYSGASPDAAPMIAAVAAKSAIGVRLLLVDDINDSGGTIARLRSLLVEQGGYAANLRFAVLLNNDSSGQCVDYAATTIDRCTDKRWFIFPWEALASQQAIVDEALSVPDRLT